MNSLYLLIALTALSTATASPIQPSCEDVHLTCTNFVQDTITDEGFNILTEETLSAHCNDIIEDITCKKNYLFTCDPTGYETFSLATDGVVEVLSELCNDTSDLRKAYGRHSPCIANISDAYQDCILTTSNSVSDYETDDNENDFYEEDVTSSDLMIRRMCRFYEPFKSCVTRETQQSCGDSAAQLIEDMIVRMASAAIKAKCPNRTE